MTRTLRYLRTVALLVPAGASAQTARIAPTENLVVDGIPPVPAVIAAAARPSSEFRAAGFWDWHPTRREMIIGTRFGDAPQLHRVRSPGGDRSQLTFFPDPVFGASYQPTDGRYIVFTKDVGGAEFFQKYRYDVATGEITLLTDGKSRNVGGAWSHKATATLTCPRAATGGTWTCGSWTRVTPPVITWCWSSRAAGTRPSIGRPTTAPSFSGKGCPSTRAICGWWTSRAVKRPSSRRSPEVSRWRTATRSSAATGRGSISRPTRAPSSNASRISTSRPRATGF